jgi:hypothetical protein
MTKSFPNNQNLKPYSDTILSVKTRLSGFCDFGFLLDFLLSQPLDAF